MRLFTALDLSPEALAAFASREARLRALVAGRRWQRPENAHLTLQFLGETPEEALSGLSAALRSACAALSPFELALGELGTFGGRRARVLWQGLTGDLAALSALERATREAIAEQGIVLETRRYSPHVTLCRELEGPVDLTALAAAAAGEPVAWRVREAVLYRSHLSSTGPRYEGLERFPLTGR